MHLDSQDSKKRIVGFRCAINGLKEVIKSELNFKIHLVIAFLVIIAGLLLQLTAIEWLLIVLTIGLVLAFEMINTAIERAMDYLAPEIHPLVGLVKDVSAGAVFVTALTSVVVACIIFLPKLFQLI